MGERGWIPITISVFALGIIAFSCCVAAEFTKIKAKDLRVDGNLCSLPRGSAFGLGITALVSLFIAQVAGTTLAAAAGLCSRGKRTGRRNPALAIALLAVSWVCFGLVTIILGTGSSMNAGQPYGRGWTNGSCYVVKDGMYIGAAAIVIVTVVLVLGFTYTMREKTQPTRTGPEMPKPEDVLEEK